MSHSEGQPSGSALASDNLIPEYSNNALVPNPLHGLARSGILDLSSGGIRELNRVSRRSQSISGHNNRANSFSRGSEGGSVNNELWIYKKTNEVPVWK